MGTTVTVTGVAAAMVTAAEPTAAGAALLVACTVNVAGVGTVAGPVYKPLPLAQATVDKAKKAVGLWTA